MRGVTLQLTTGPGLAIDRDGRVELDGVVVRDATGVGIQVDGGQLVGRSLVVMHIGLNPNPEDGPARGVLISGGGQATLGRTVIHHVQGDGLYATGDQTVVTMNESVIAGSVIRRAAGGIGVHVLDEAQVRMSGVAIEGNTYRAGYVSGAGASLQLDDSIIRGNGGSADAPDKWMMGIWANEGAALSLDRVALIENVGGGLFVTDESQAVAEDIVVADSHLLPGGDDGQGIRSYRGARLEIRRAHISGNHEVGLHAFGSELVGEDLLVEDTMPEMRTAGEGGIGLIGHVGAVIDIRRAVFARNHIAGLHVWLGCTATFSDLVVRDTRSHETLGIGGRGVDVAFDTDLELSRAVIEANRDVGISVSSADSTAVLRDVRVTGTEGREIDGRFGSGILVSGAQAEISQTVLEQNRHVGLFVSQAGDAQLSDVAVMNTEVQQCVVRGDCPQEDAAFGVGLGVYQNSTVRASGFAVVQTPLCGVHLTPNGSADLERGLVQGNAIGACVQIPDYSVERLANGVSYADNVRNLDTPNLPVPSSSPPIAIR